MTDPPPIPGELVWFRVDRRRVWAFVELCLFARLLAVGYATAVVASRSRRGRPAAAVRLLRSAAGRALPRREQRRARRQMGTVGPGVRGSAEGGHVRHAVVL